MLKKIFAMLIICLAIVGCASKHETILVEAESFDNKGGWVTDQQFMDVMGSPFLMAHGLGSPVDDATTELTFKQKGKYHIFVRTRNWAAQWSEDGAPGKFQLILDGIRLSKMLGISKIPESAGNFDVVVAGGGMAGTCAAISAARLGLKVALIQNRPVLGGNNSSEVRVHLGGRINLEPYPALGNLVNEIGPERGGNAQVEGNYEDEKKLNAVLKEKNISLFLNHHANNVILKNGKISAIVAQNIETTEELRFSAPLFADCTGDGTIGLLAGAEHMSGRESRDVFGEKTAPEKADNLTMGASVQWFSEKLDAAVTFPDINWGLAWNEAKAEAITRGDWNWETGMGFDMLKDFEQIRDYGMLVVFSNWSYIKNHSNSKEEFANENLKWVAYIAGKRESYRLKGDYVLIEQDLIEKNIYPDGTASTSWTIDLHYPDPENSKLFPGAEFKSIARHIEIYPYPIPFRCLYSKNIDNLLMAGRNISVSHVALGTTRLMRTCGMEGEVIGMAASICIKENTSPRGILNDHFPKLQELMNTGIGKPDLPKIQKYNLGGTLLGK